MQLGTPTKQSLQEPEMLTDLYSTVDETLNAWAGARLDPELNAKAEELRQSAYEEIRRLPKALRDETARESACKIVERFVTSGFVDQVAPWTDLAAANASAEGSWPEKLSALLAAPAWLLSGFGRISDQPMWLWPTLGNTLFRLPATAPAAREAKLMYEVYVGRLRELEMLAKANRGSSAVRALLERYLSQASVRCFLGVETPLLELLSLKASVARFAAGFGRADSVFVTSRADRRFRVGFLIDSLAEGTYAREALAWLTALDRELQDSIVFVVEPTSGELSAHIGERATELKLLSGDFSTDIQMMKESGLDALVFFTDVVEGDFSVNRYAQHRVAPLQLAVDANKITTGFRSVDLVLCDSWGAQAPAELRTRFSERVAIVPPLGLPLSCNVGRPASSVEWDRAGLGFAATDVVYASLTPFEQITSDRLEVCADILAAVPSSKMLLYSYAPQDQESAAVEKLLLAASEVFGRKGVALERLIVSNESFPSLAEVAALLKISNVYLDLAMRGADEGVKLALEGGLPVVSLRSSVRDSNRVSESFSEYGLQELLASTPAEFADKAVRLGVEEQERQNIQEKIREALGNEGQIFDLPVFGAWFGRLLEAAYDELYSKGEVEFGLQKIPFSLSSRMPVGALLDEAEILLQSDLLLDAETRSITALTLEPGSIRARRFYYDVLFKKGSYSRAADGMLAAVFFLPQRADLWFRLSKALRLAGRRQEAIQTLEVSLRLDQRNADGWSMLSEMAIESGDLDMHREVQDILEKLQKEAAPADAAPQLSGPRKKSLYFSPVGARGRAFLEKALKAFPKEEFDFLIISYDGSDFSDLGEHLKVVKEKGQKWRLIKKHLTPDVVEQYDYVFLWDDDIDVRDFDGVRYLELVRKNRLDISQPSLSKDSYIFHPITAQRTGSLGRVTNFVEIMVPVYSSRVWRQVYEYLDPEVNEWGWGYDLLPIGRKGIVDEFSVCHTRPGQSGNNGAREQYATWCQKYQIHRPEFRDLEPLQAP